MIYRMKIKQREKRSLNGGTINWITKSLPQNPRAISYLEHHIIISVNNIFCHAFESNQGDSFLKMLHE